MNNMMNMVPRNDELAHWGIKGQKWGIRRYQNDDGTLTEAGKKRYRYQNPDGSLTEEGKKDYMTAARKGKLDISTLSNQDLDMINSRFEKEQKFAKNVQSYRESRFSYKLQKAILDRIRGGGGNKKGGGGKKGNVIKELLASSIRDAFKPISTGSDDNGGNRDRNDGSSAAVRGYDPRTGQPINGSRHRAWRFNDGSSTSEEILRGRHSSSSSDAGDSGSSGGTSRGGREGRRSNFSESRNRGEQFVERDRSTMSRPVRGLPSGDEALGLISRRSQGRSYRLSTNHPRLTSGVRGLRPGGIYLNPDEYSIHSGIASFRISRSDELYHYGIKGQKWGVRRFQNDDRTLTAAGKERYGKGSSPKERTQGLVGSSTKSEVEFSRKAYLASEDKGIRRQLNKVINESNDSKVKDALGIADAYNKVREDQDKAFLEYSEKLRKARGKEWDGDGTEEHWALEERYPEYKKISDHEKELLKSLVENSIELSKTKDFQNIKGFEKYGYYYTSFPDYGNWYRKGDTRAYAVAQELLSRNGKRGYGAGSVFSDYFIEQFDPKGNKLPSLYF